MSERVSKTELIELPVGLTTKEEAYQKLKRMKLIKNIKKGRLKTKLSSL